jgi:hypothetical protein
LLSFREPVFIASQLQAVRIQAMATGERVSRMAESSRHLGKRSF